MNQLAVPVFQLVVALMVLVWLFTRRRPRQGWLCPECNTLHDSRAHAEDCMRADREPSGTWAPTTGQKLLIAALLVSTPAALLSLGWFAVDLFV